MRLKSKIEDLLRDYPPLFRFASKVYHTINGSFRTLSPGAPDAIRKSFQYLIDNQGSVSGDYYEFGLFRGYTFLEAYKHCKELNLDSVNFYGFDSFEGLPEAEGIDQVDGRFFKGQFACSRPAVEKSLQQSGVNLDEIHLIEGYYEDSLTDQLHSEHDFKPVSVALLDCDYYSSTVTALTWLDRYIQNGSILLFDDWFSYGENEELGQQKAFAEFLERHPELSAEPLWEFQNHGKGFLIKSA